MDRNRIEDQVSSDGLCNAAAVTTTTTTGVQSNKRLTPGGGKFVVDSSGDCDTSSLTSQKSFDEPKEDRTFYIYSGAMDTNSIWNSSGSDYKKTSSSVLSNNQDSLNSIWSSKYNSNESLTKQDNHCQMPPISIDINEFELHDNNFSLLNETGADIPNIARDMKENISVEDRRKISTMINSHDGWGVKPINQNTPWIVPEGENDSDNYPDTFSTWMADTSNGAYAWEATKRLPGPDWSNNVKGKSYNMPAKPVIWSTGTNDSIWANSNVFNSCSVGGSNKIKSNVTQNFTTLDSNNSNYMTNTGRMERSGRISQEHTKNPSWPPDMTGRQMNEYKPMPSSIPVDRFASQRSKNIDNEIQLYKHWKDTQKQIVEQYHKEQRKIQEIDNNLNSVAKLPESQSRPIINELLRQRQVTQHRMQLLRSQHEALLQKLNMLEEILINYQRSNCGTSTPVDKQFARTEMNNSSMPVLDMLANKLGSIQMQPSQDFRLDVPEFVPGKKWHGLSQNGKENRNPTVFNKLCPQYSDTCNDTHQDPAVYPLIWLYIQNLPSHITMEMIQSFFIQSNNPCIMPIHSNPFSRWMLIRFPNAFSSQKALQLLSGKIGQSTLLTDQDASIKLQELKGVMAKFVAHQN